MWWKNYSIWLKTERETVISNYSDFTKIAPTVPLCSGLDHSAQMQESFHWLEMQFALQRCTQLWRTQLECICALLFLDCTLVSPFNWFAFITNTAHFVKHSCTATLCILQRFTARRPIGSAIIFTTFPSDFSPQFSSFHHSFKRKVV